MTISEYSRQSSIAIPLRSMHEDRGNAVRNKMSKVATVLSPPQPFAKSMIVLSHDEGIQFMQRFEFRHPRFSVDLPARFSIANETLAGRCTDISTKGMRLELPHAVAPGSCGTVSMRFQDQTIELNARIAHTTSAYSGLEFLCDSIVVCGKVAHLVASLAAPRNRRPMALVPRCDAPSAGPSTKH
jgi:hypothetical protein